MSDIWAYHESFAGDRDIVGFSVEARDGGIGKVDEASYDAGRGHLVVDTGPWIFGRRVMLPAGIVTRVDWDAETVHVDRTKQEIKAAPELGEGRGGRGGDVVGDDAYRARIASYYGEPGRGSRPF